MRLYILAVSTAFVLVLAGAVAAGLDPIAHPERIAPLLGLSIAAEALVVRQQQRPGADVLSFSATAHIATAVVFGPVTAALVAAFAVFVVDGLRLQPRRHILINSAMFGLSIWCAGTAFDLVGGTVGEVSTGAVPAILVLVATRFTVNTLIYCGAFTLGSGRQLFAVLRDEVRDSAGPAVGEGALGVLVAYSYVGEHWVVLPFLVPLLAALYTSKANFERLKGETENVLNNFASVIDERDPSTASHSERVAEYVARFVDAIGLSDREQERLVDAARFHDLGKIAVDVATLTRSGRLSDAELTVIRSHPRLSARLLAPFHFAQEMSLWAELHHERYDGRGYYSVPQREIPVEAHVLIVADSFDAMTSARAYRPALSLAEAAQELRDKAGTQFHPLVAAAFAAMIEGDDVEGAMGDTQLGALRAEFSRIPTVRRPALPSLFQPGSVAVNLGAATLVGVGIEEISTTTVVALACATALASVVWMVGVVSTRRRAARLRAALAAGAPAAATLAAASVAAWATWLDWDEEGVGYVARDPHTAVGERPPASEVAEACERARRLDDGRQTTLAGGTHLVVVGAEGDPRRFAVASPDRLSAFELELVRVVAAEQREPATDAPPALTPVAAVEAPRRAAGPLRAVIAIDLDAYENVRVVAGQLTAERVVADAEARVRRLLRAGDQVVRLGEDRLGLVLALGSDDRLGPVCDRVRQAIEDVPVPRRAAALRPRIRTAEGDAVAGDPDLMAVLEAADAPTRRAA